MPLGRTPLGQAHPGGGHAATYGGQRIAVYSPWRCVHLTL